MEWILRMELFKMNEVNYLLNRMMNNIRRTRDNYERKKNQNVIPARRRSRFLRGSVHFQPEAHFQPKVSSFSRGMKCSLPIPLGFQHTACTKYALISDWAAESIAIVSSLTKLERGTNVRCLQWNVSPVRHRRTCLQRSMSPALCAKRVFSEACLQPCM